MVAICRSPGTRPKATQTGRYGRGQVRAVVASFSVDTTFGPAPNGPGLIHPLPAPFGDGERINFLPNPRHGRTGRQRRLRSFPFADEEVFSCAISAMRKPWPMLYAMA